MSCPSRLTPLRSVDYIAGHDGVDTAEDVYDKIAGAGDSLETMPRRCRIVPELAQQLPDPFAR